MSVYTAQFLQEYCYENCDLLAKKSRIQLEIYVYMHVRAPNRLYMKWTCARLHEVKKYSWQKSAIFMLIIVLPMVPYNTTTLCTQ